MKIIHALVLALATQATLAGASRAEPVASIEPRQNAPRPERVDLGALPGLPDACRQFLEVPADATGEWLAWAQRLSLAACRQVRGTPIAADDPNKLPRAIAELDAAARPSIAIYKDAMARGPVQIQMLAAYGLGMTYVNIIVRARASIPAPPDLMTNLPAADTFLGLHHALEPLLVTHGRDAVAAFGEADRLATQDPARASANAVMTNVIAGARAALHALAGR